MYSAYPGEQHDLRWVTVTLTSIATILLICRLSITFKNRGWLGIEDALVITANMWLIAFAICVYMATIYGFGLKGADIEKSGGNFKKAIKFFWLTQVFYTLTNGFNKMAFIALYYRVFPMPRFRLICKIFGAVSVGWTISYIFVVIFQCTPIARVYDRSIPGTCISFFGHRWSNAITNLITDIAIFILPMPIIVRLNMSLGSRVGLVVLFSMGFFICLTTALRMGTLPLTLRTKDPTWESAPTNLWSFIEAATGVICACLISLRKAIAALWPRKWRSTRGASSGYQQYGNSRPTGNALSAARGPGGTDTSHSYAMGNVKSGSRGRPDTYADISPSESQEHIMEGKKTVAHITTSRPRSSESGSEDLVFEGITVTTDVKVVRE